VTANSQDKSRIDALDLTKGVLVLLMVLYHSINYTSEYYLAFKYIAFLPPSFIFITGYLLSVVYLPRYDRQSKNVCKRLLVRGAKLVALFTALNVLAHLFIRRGRAGERLDALSFFTHWQDVYITGAGRFAVFEVLLPIGYLLVLAPVFLWLAHRSRSGFVAATVLLLSGCTWFEYCGYPLSNLNLLSAGVFGMAIGLCPVEKLALLGRYFPITLLAYGIYLLIGLAIGQPFLVQILGATVALAAIFSVCTQIKPDGPLRVPLALLGQYSLISYIAQIGILQLLSKFTGRPEPISTGAAFLFCATLILTILAAKIVDLGRNRSSSVDLLYKAVFA